MRNVQNIGQWADAVGWSAGALPVDFSASFKREVRDGQQESHTWMSIHPGPWEAQRMHDVLAVNL